MRPVLLMLAPCAVLSLITSAQAGVTVGLQQDNKNAVIYLEGNKMRVEGDPGDAHNTGLVIYDGDQQKVFLVDQEKKTYQEVTPQSVRAMVDKTKTVDQHMANMSPEQRKQMEQMMSKLSPEQRKTVDGMMGKKSEQPKEPDLKWEPTGAHQTVAGFSCEGYKELKDGKVDAEGCYIPWSAGAITKADLAPLMRMKDFIKQAGYNFPQQGIGAFAKLEQGPGFPGTRVRISASGEREGKESVTSIKRGSISADKFQLPTGYSKTDDLGAMR
jgi:hypothetical protein